MRGQFLKILTVAATVALAGSPAQATTEVNIGLSSPDVAALLVYVAQDKGFYKAEGLDTKLVQFETDSAAAQAMTAGAVDINCASVFPVIDSYIAGRDLTVVWSLSNLPGYVWFGPAKDNSIKDIKGGKVGISSVGSMSHRISAWAVIKGGLDPDKDVQFIALGGPLNRMAALKAGQADLIPATAPGIFLLEQEGFKPLLAMKDYMPEFSYETYYIRKANIDKKDAMIRGVIRATVKAKQWALAHREEATDVLMKNLGSPADQKALYEKTVDFALPYFPENGKLPKDSIDLFLGFYKDQGKLKEIPPLSAFTDFRYIDDYTKNPIK